MSSETIMLVDDNKQCHLKSLGWEVIPASKGRELLEKVRRVRPSMIVLDMEMPEMDGFDGARSLKEDPNYRDIPVLPATALPWICPKTENDVWQRAATIIYRSLSRSKK